MIEPFHFEKNDKKGFYSLVPDSWLFIGPTGNEPDSILKKFRTRDTLSQQTFIMQASKNYRKVLQDFNYPTHVQSLDESLLFDVLRTEIFRISSIDVANSDFIYDSAALPSLKGSINSWLMLTKELANELPASSIVIQKRWQDLSAGTIKFLSTNIDNQSFNRMYFTRNYLIPLSECLNNMQVAFKIPFLKKDAAIKSDAKHIYDRNIFNADYFAPGKDAAFSIAKAKLGELLFFDPILSDNNKRACASCHKPALAFTDGLPKSVSFTRELLPRNSPTVINAVIIR